MDDALTARGPIPPTAPTVPLRRVGLACAVGTTIEYYDFFIFGTCAALVFPDVFFPNLGSTMATVAAFATFATAFLARPLGASFFGHFGDRIGRKKTLVMTLLIMGVSTTAVGLVPPAASMGIAAPLILVILRLFQGFAVGGEWPGSAVLSAEYAPDGKRGRFGMFTQLGAGGGVLLAAVAFLVVNSVFGETSTTFLAWGWRLPFLFSAVLVLVALYARFKIAEPPVFVETKQTFLVKTPLVELLSTQLRQVVLMAGLLSTPFAFSYLGSTYLLGYANDSLGYSRNLVLVAGVLGACSLMVFTAVSAMVCDALGRRRVCLFGTAAGIPVSFVIMPLLGTNTTVGLMAGIVAAMSIVGFVLGPVSAYVPEIFATRYRYTGAGLAYNLAGVVGGAGPTVIAGALLAAFGSTAIGVMMASIACVSLTCCYLLPETKGRTLRHGQPAELADIVDASRQSCPV